ncbi:MAG: TIGR01212 family radical SAM protein [Pirellulales bacterium]|nr:TIGR01212 family radical SAM protein [Pirellulales bacterium]
MRILSLRNLTSNPVGWVNSMSWRDAGYRYSEYNFFLRQRFGGRIQRISIDGGFTCPNRDGSIGTGGCAFCNNRSFSPSRRMVRAGITEQIDRGMDRLRLRYRNCAGYIAYFQPATNTYAPVERLRWLYEEALRHPHIVGLAIGTRCDCVPPPVLHLLQEIAERTYLSVEYGLQTMHNPTLAWMNRGHNHDSFIDAVQRSRGLGFSIGAHVILGLPGESHDDMMATAREVGRLHLDAVKIHNLYVAKDTRLADAFAAGEVPLMSLAEYVTTLVDFLEWLPPDCVIERTFSNAPADYLLGPAWCLNRGAVRDAIRAEFERRETWQGRKFLG